jgi:hypothetical protein
MPFHFEMIAWTTFFAKHKAQSQNTPVIRAVLSGRRLLAISNFNAPSTQRSLKDNHDR